MCVLLAHGSYGSYGSYESRGDFEPMVALVVPIDQPVCALVTMVTGAPLPQLAGERRDALVTMVTGAMPDGGWR